jgi:hypothetical protein
MAPPFFRRVAAATDLLRPRTLFRTLARVDDVADATRDLRATVEALQVRTDQLQAIMRLDWEQQESLIALPQRLDCDRIRTHISRAIEATPLLLDPFPHLVAENWLPQDIYDLIIEALPPPIFFADRETARQRLRVPFSFAPSYSRRVWTFVADHIVGDTLKEALSRKFDTNVRAYLDEISGGAEDLNVALHPSDGRIMLRRPGYVISPHRDPKWGFITGLIYLARKGDNETYGTQLYRVSDDAEAPGDKPFYVSEDRCELVRSVPFRANTLLAFMNSRGAHGASIPADAKPASLERYVYQFRLGPDNAAIRQLLDRMPAERRPLWAGAKAQKASTS